MSTSTSDGANDKGSGLRLFAPKGSQDLNAEAWPEPRGLGSFVSDEEEQERALTLLDYVGIVIKWRWLIAGAVLVGIAAAVISTLLATPLYHATATIQIDQEPAKIEAVTNPDQPDYYDSDQFYQTEYALLRSPSLATRVATNENLASDPAFMTQYARGLHRGYTPPGNEAQRAAKLNQAAGLVLAGLKIDPVHGSRLVQVTYQSPNPGIAAKIANALAQNFITANLEHRYDASAYARKFLEDRLEQTRQRLEDSEKALVAYAAANKIINLNIEEQSGPNGQQSTGETSLAATTLATVNQALSGAISARIQAEQRWRQAESAPDPMSIPEVQADAAAQAALAARAASEAEYRQDRSTMQPDHPTMLALQAKIDEETRDINTRVAAIKASLQNQYAVALHEEQALGGQVNSNTGAVLDQRSKSIQYNILQREVDTNKTLYDGLLQRYKEIGVAGAIDTNNISVVDPAKVPGGPFSPVLSRNLAFYAAVGLAIGTMLAFLLERFDVSIKVPEDVELKLGVPLLGTVPKAPRDIAMPAAMIDGRSVISEAYSSVRTALNFSTHQGAPRTLLITSARPSEGKTVTATSLARSFARLGLQVLLIDGDMRDPSLHRLLSRDNGIGLSNILSGGVNPPAAIQPTDQENLWVIPCGPRPPSPTELLSGEQLRTVLAFLTQKFALIVIDGPPILGLADAPLLSEAVDGVLMVVEAGVTKRELARMALRRLRMVHSRVVGVVLTKFDIKKAGYSYGYMYGHGSGYGYGYDYGIETKPRWALLGGSKNKRRREAQS